MKVALTIIEIPHEPTQYRISTVDQPTRTKVLEQWLTENSYTLNDVTVRTELHPLRGVHPHDRS